MRFSLFTLGCKVNQYETQVIREAWERLGHTFVSDALQTEVLLVHSCAVTAKALADLRKTVAALHRAAPDTSILVTGCAAQIHGTELVSLAGVSQVIGLADRGLILNGPEVLLAGPERGGRTPSLPTVLEGVGGFSRARAQVKVQDGCSHGCTYCIVPQARGVHRSRAPRAVADEIRLLLAAGFREISLIGVNLRLYGRDLFPGMDFWDLIRFLERIFASQWAGRARIRLTSLDPAMLDAKALDVLAGSEMICPHLHLSLQSGSEEVLQRMGRGHNHPEETAHFCSSLVRVWPIFALGADLLAGFPGEGEGHFQETMGLCAALPLTYAHVFPFSARPGTPASLWPDQVPEALRRNRAKTLRRLARKKKEAFLEKILGLEGLTVVVERLEPIRGKCEFYVPCEFNGTGESSGLKSLMRARPEGLSSGVVLCSASAARHVIENSDHNLSSNV